MGKVIRDSNVSRNYRALKLALWITEKSYWQGGLTERQAMSLIERTLNHREVTDRWGHIQVEVEFTEEGYTAWAIPDPTLALLHLPMNGCTPLIILHEIAHLLEPTRREAHHGPGFTAIHLMLVELMKPRLLQAMLASYAALCVPWDASRIPGGTSKYAPLLGSVELVSVRHELQALAASGAITEKERTRLTQVLKQMKDATPPPLRPMPTRVEISTEALLACNTDRDIAALVLDKLAFELEPREMKRPPVKPPHKR